MSADRHLTPRVVAYLADALPSLDPERRASFEAAQLVLRQLCRWARMIDPDDPGRWRSTESVEQLVAGTGLTVATVKRALTTLDAIGLAVTVKRGGGRGTGARGSIRTLALDPVDNRKTGRGYRAQFAPQLGAVDGETRRGNGETRRGQPRHTASSSASSSARIPDDDALNVEAVDRDEVVSTDGMPGWFADRLNRRRQSSADTDDRPEIPVPRMMWEIPL